MTRTGRNSFTPVLNRSFRWRWVIRYLMLQPLFHQTKITFYHCIWGRFGPWTSLNVLWKWKIFWTYKEFDLDCLAHNLITIPHIHISTVLMCCLGCWIGQHVGRNQRRFWEQPQKGKGHRLTFFGVPYADSIAALHHSPCPLLRWRRWMGDAQSLYWNLYEK